MEGLCGGGGKIVVRYTLGSVSAELVSVLPTSLPRSESAGRSAEIGHVDGEVVVVDEKSLVGSG